MTWYRIDQACERCSVSRRIIYAAVASGELRAARIGAGRNLRFSDKWLDQWLEARATRLRGEPEDALPALRRTG